MNGMFKHWLIWYPWLLGRHKDGPEMLQIWHLVPFSNHENGGNHYRIKENIEGYVIFNQHILDCRKNVGGHL